MRQDKYPTLEPSSTVGCDCAKIGGPWFGRYVYIHIYKYPAPRLGLYEAHYMACISARCVTVLYSRVSEFAGKLARGDKCLCCGMWAK
jgi:hypothetical protein